MLLTVHKAASSYVGEILSDLFQQLGYRPYDPGAEAFGLGLDGPLYLGENADRLLQPQCFFGPLRGDVAQLAAQASPARPILHVRDPRDCIVSLYYSLRYSHVVPPGPKAAAFLELRQELTSMSVDDFARNAVYDELLTGGYYVRTFELMRRLMAHRDDVILSRYEDMVLEFPDWIVRLVDALFDEIDYEPVLDLIAKVDFLVSMRVEEDPLRHKRQVMPGDHRRKLRQATQNLLTDFFADDLRCFGYLS